MPEVRIAAEARSEFGKGAARRVRRAGRVPGVLYGHGTDTRHISLPGHELMMALKTPNALLRLDGLPGGSQLSLPKAVQRDPLRGDLEHVDLVLVRQGEKVTVDVPVTLTGDVVPGGLVDQQMIQVSIEAEATAIPQGIEVDVTGMEVGSAIHASDLKLPPGATLVAESEALVVHVLAAPTAEQIEAEIGGAPAEGAAASGAVPPAPGAGSAGAESSG